MKPSPLTESLIKGLDTFYPDRKEGNIEIVPMISELSSLYEKFRNSLEYREDQVVLQGAIERILKRKLLLGKLSGPIAPILVRELVWAKYFNQNEISEELIEQIDRDIHFYLDLEKLSQSKHRKIQASQKEWFVQLLSTRIERSLRPDYQKELMINYFFYIINEKIEITGASEQTRDAQVFIAIRRAFAKENESMLRYALFIQFFEEIDRKHIENIAKDFLKYQREAESQLRSPYLNQIQQYIKKVTPPFLILQDVFIKNNLKAGELIEDEERLSLEIMKMSNLRYREISNKIFRAVVRSVLFIFMTKVIFALAVETTLENFIYGSINWFAIGINTLFFPVLMYITTLSIKTPDTANSRRLAEMIKEILYSPTPEISKPLILDKNSPDNKGPKYITYLLFWLISLMAGFLLIHSLLSLLSFNIIGELIFALFLAIVSFISYRISLIAQTYTVKANNISLGSILFDFFFVPFIEVGRRLSAGISKVNIFIFVLDYLIEAPFKESIAFVERWLLFMHSQREKING